VLLVMVIYLLGTAPLHAGSGVLQGLLCGGTPYLDLYIAVLPYDMQVVCQCLRVVSACGSAARPVITHWQQ
jgi:hypothetical protein